MNLKWKTRYPINWDLPVHWAEILFAIRKENNLSRKDLAEMSGVSSSTIENYEKKKIKEPSIYKVEQLLNAMGYDLDALKYRRHP
tara:strand:+ start:4782 stop:5036 length:255 start_codon:yes stop_codon:yes gene_type:complete